MPPKNLQFIDGFSEIAGYEINTHKFVAFLHTNSELSEREIKETVPFTIKSKVRNIILTNIENKLEVISEAWKDRGAR